MYGDSPIKITEKLLNHPHIKAEKKLSQEFSPFSNIEANHDVSAHGTGITDSILYTNTSSSVATIFFLRCFTSKTDFKPLIIKFY
jgi:hypothetical protein